METYEEFINNILETRGRFACGDEYHERHHIVPKCIGGSNDKDNLIDLYAREHFEAHRLLALENPEDDKLTFAWRMMAFVQGDNQERYKISSEEYEEIKIANAKIRKEKFSGENHPMYGKKDLIFLEKTTQCTEFIAMEKQLQCMASEGKIVRIMEAIGRKSKRKN